MNNQDHKTLLPFKMITESDIEKMRYDTFWTKEPETINWIKSFPEDNVFLDIGANIGVYSLYNAKLHPKSLTIACEPFMGNYLRLHNNIAMNGFMNILVVCVGFSNQNAFLPLYLPDNTIGSSGGQLRSPTDAQGNTFPIAGAQDVMTFRIETFLDTFTHMDKLIKPTHIKIDVDGRESEILEGLQTLPELQSILIEFNNKEVQEKYIDLFLSWGFTDNNEFNKFSPHSRDRRVKEGDNASVNVIFTREINDAKKDTE